MICIAILDDDQNASLEMGRLVAARRARRDHRLHGPLSNLDKVV